MSVDYSELSPARQEQIENQTLPIFELDAWREEMTFKTLADGVKVEGYGTKLRQRGLREPNINDRAWAQSAAEIRAREMHGYAARDEDVRKTAKILSSHHPLFMTSDEWEAEKAVLLAGQDPEQLPEISKHGQEHLQAARQAFIGYAAKVRPKRSFRKEISKRVNNYRDAQRVGAYAIATQITSSITKHPAESHAQATAVAFNEHRATRTALLNALPERIADKLEDESIDSLAELRWKNLHAITGMFGKRSAPAKTRAVQRTYKNTVERTAESELELAETAQTLLRRRRNGRRTIAGGVAAALLLAGALSGNTLTEDNERDQTRSASSTVEVEVDQRETPATPPEQTPEVSVDTPDKSTNIRLAKSVPLQAGEGISHLIAKQAAANDRVLSPAASNYLSEQLVNKFDGDLFTNNTTYIIGNGEFAGQTGIGEVKRTTFKSAVLKALKKQLATWAYTPKHRA